MSRALFRCMVAVVTCLALTSCRVAPPGQLTVTFLDVGQGDGIVIETPEGRVVVVDGGGKPGMSESDGADPGHRVLLPYLRSKGIRQVDLMIATHPDEDHIQGLIPIARHLRVGACLVSETSQGGASARLRYWLQRRGGKLRRAVRGEAFRVGPDVVLEILHPGVMAVVDSRSPANDNGIAFRLVAGKASILFVADLEAAAERDLLRSGQPLHSQILKVGHHGSRTSTTDAFLDAVRPWAAVISCGKGNRFGHPAPEVVERLVRRGVSIWRTDRQGAIVVRREGDSWVVRGYQNEGGPDDVRAARK